jgi:hypothetical protein
MKPQNMDFESSDRLKFAHCSYLLLLRYDVHITCNLQLMRFYS